MKSEAFCAFNRRGLCFKSGLVESLERGKSILEGENQMKPCCPAGNAAGSDKAASLRHAVLPAAEARHGTRERGCFGGTYI